MLDSRAVAPLARIFGDLSANPIEFIEHRTGDWALRFLLITLAVTPLRKIFEQPLLTRFRRMLGLFAFFYVCVHLSMYLTFDQMFSISGIFADVLKRPYITVAPRGFLMLVPLAITSTRRWCGGWSSAGSCCIAWCTSAPSPA